MNEFTDSDLNDIDFSEIEKAFSGDLTPLEYNGGQLDKQLLPDGELPVCVGIDWCELSLRGDLSYLEKSEQYEKGDFKLVRNDIRSRHFGVAFSVYHCDVLFGLLLCSPRSKVIPVEVIQFKVDNQHFYKAGRHRLNYTITQLLSSLDLTFNNFTRLDIFIDFYRFNSSLTFEEFVHRYSVGDIETKGKITKWNPFYSRIGGRMLLTGFSMGSRSSDKFLRCYNKSVEIVNSHKTYIREWWDKNGMNVEGDIYRFELQLTSKWFREVKPFKLSQSETGELVTEKILTNLLSLSTKDSLISLLQLGLKNYFDFFIQDERKVRNDDKIPFETFDWQAVRNGCKRVYHYVREKLRHQKFTWRQKMIVARNIFREYVLNFQDAGWLKYCARVIFDYDLVKRWEKARERYVQEFMNTVAFRYEWNEGKFLSDWATHIANFKLLPPAEQLSLGFVLPVTNKFTDTYYKNYPHLRLHGDGVRPELPPAAPENDECPF